VTPGIRCRAGIIATFSRNRFPAKGSGASFPLGAPHSAILLIDTLSTTPSEVDRHGRGFQSQQLVDFSSRYWLMTRDTLLIAFSLIWMAIVVAAFFYVVLFE
jgi:hypothetical protein